MKAEDGVKADAGNSRNTSARAEAGNDSLLSETADASARGDTVSSAAPDAEAGASDEQCWLEYLGDWVRCEKSGEPPDSFLLESTSAQDCVEDCLNDPKCTAVADYYWRGWNDVGCGVMLNGGCDEPSNTGWSEDDGAKEYRKVCGDAPPKDAITRIEPPAHGARCTFESLLLGEGCSASLPDDDEAIGAESLDECFELCAAREDCGAVIDWTEPGDRPHECVLYLATCDEVVTADVVDSADLVYYFRKDCPMVDVDGAP